MPSGLDGHPDPVTSPQRRRVLSDLADEVDRRRDPRRADLVAVDGIDGAGKSTFADALAGALTGRGRTVIRATTDSFHQPRSQRWARGPLSPEGFYRDSHDLDRLTALLLDPLSGDPPRPFRRAAFDEPTDAAVTAPEETAAGGSVLVFDGLFLHRPELRGYWDLSIWLDGQQRVSRQRIDRARAHIGPGPEGLVAFAWWCAVLGRYVGGMRLYEAECRPQERVDAVVRNDDIVSPTLEWRPAESPYR